jgi:MFS family permease
MKNFIKRNGLWIAVASVAAILIGPIAATYRTLLIAVLIECLALGLSGLAAFAYTKLDFIKENAESTLGRIFLGVHICAGLSVLSVYFTQI